MAPTAHPELISIITPAFNAARFVEETIRAVQAQTHENWEMLIADDCSHDSTAALVEGISSSDARVRLLRQQSNGGPARVRNAALSAARSALVAFVDSDDLWLPQKLERQLQFMRRSGAGLSYTGFRRIDEQGRQLGLLRPIPESLNYDQYLKNTAIVTSTVMVDRGITGDFRMPITRCDDFAAWLSIMRRGHVAMGLAEDLLRYRVVGNSISRNKARWAAGVWQTYRDIEKLALPYAAWCFCNYAWRGFRKYRVL